MRKCLFASVAIVAMVLVAAGCTQNQDSADTEQTRQLTRQGRLEYSERGGHHRSKRNTRHVHRLRGQFLHRPAKGRH